MSVAIAVYADWEGLSRPCRIGMLHASRSRGREVFEFEFDQKALADPALSGPTLDPRIRPFGGRQHPPQDRDTFGVFEDASPDRWGRLLIRRRFEREQRRGLFDEQARLHESDYLLGVHDVFRAGALRFRLDDSGDFLDDRHGGAAPPFVRLHELESATRALERDESNTDAAGDEWLRMLIAPGGSLGGARPKASVVDPNGRLWIAKFPSVRDEHDVGAWELLVHALALRCELRVPESLARRFASPQHTFLVKRFDRTERGRRLHFASAMTLTGRRDGEDASTGASYLELARVLVEQGAQADVDLRQLWSRIVFNLLVSNSDDHLRNHGFLLAPGAGWRLSDAFDMNPVANARGLRLNITEVDNSLDLELARAVAPYFRVSSRAANDVIENSRRVVRNWPALARKLRISSREQDGMASAFRLADA